jgi:hypothetical protein
MMCQTQTQTSTPRTCPFAASASASASVVGARHAGHRTSGCRRHGLLMCGLESRASGSGSEGPQAGGGTLAEALNAPDKDVGR